MVFIYLLSDLDLTVFVISRTVLAQESPRGLGAAGWAVSTYSADRREGAYLANPGNSQGVDWPGWNSNGARRTPMLLPGLSSRSEGKERSAQREGVAVEVAQRIGLLSTPALPERLPIGDAHTSERNPVETAPVKSKLVMGFQDLKSLVCRNV